MVKQCKYLKDMLVCSTIKKTYNTCIAMNVIRIRIRIRMFYFTKQ